MVRIRNREPNRMRTVMCAGLEEDTALRSFNVPTKLKTFLDSLLVRRAGQAHRLSIEVDGEVSVLRHFPDVWILREHRHPTLYS